MYINDNVCECGHAKVQHFVNSKFESQACSLNQRVCDCWQYKPKYIEHREYVDLQITGGR